MTAEDIRTLPADERAAIVTALTQMSQAPSTMHMTARILDVTYEGVRKSIKSERPGRPIRDKLVHYLFERGVIHGETTRALLDRFGPAAARQVWTWQKVLALPDSRPERRIAVRVASKRGSGVSAEAAAHIILEPPWIYPSFLHREPKWWENEMLEETRRSESAAAMTPEQIAEVVAEDYRVLKAG